MISPHKWPVIWIASLCCDLIALNVFFPVPYVHRTLITLGLGLYSLSGKTAYGKISWCLEGARWDVKINISLWNMTGMSAALLPMSLPNFVAIGKVETRLSRHRNFTRYCCKTLSKQRPWSGSARFAYYLNKDPVGLSCHLWDSRQMVAITAGFIRML